MNGVLLAALLASAPWPTIRMDRIVGGLSAPTHVTSANDGSGRLFVVEQSGRVRVVLDGFLQTTPFLDIQARVSCCGERGLLSIVFPPGSGPKTDFYVDYTDLNGDTTISRFRVSADPHVADAASEQILLKIAQPFTNHNGGQLAFGPDGYLYVGMGDGGSAGDPFGNGQSLTTLLGKILRIDVLGGVSPYGIPANNPFAGPSSARPEIWAYGLRNPWRFSFDRKTGDLYVGDVGQNAWEEVDVQAAGAPGGANYGWNVTEATHCFNPASGCSFTGITLPVAEYGHVGGNCSITGGFVYRGPDFAGMNGVYFYADYCSGRVWGLRRGASGWETQELLDTAYAITSFGEDEAGEVYAVDGTSGNLYHLVETAGPNAVRTVPVVVDVAGVNGARFVSELTLGNHGGTDATVSVTFTASDALGSRGSGTFTTTVAAGRQLVFADALQWLRQNGLFIPLGDQGGTLRLAFTGVSTGDAAFASVRTLALLPAGRAGLAYPALSPNELLDAPAILTGLREDVGFRSNLGLLNAGDPSSGGSITLRVTVFSGASGDRRSATLPDVVLGPGQWTQLNRVLASAGLANGWATVERVAGADPFFTYAVVNDNTTGDGAYVAPARLNELRDRLLLPVAVHTGAFTTELCLTNAGTTPLRLTFGGFASDRDALLQAGEQRFVPDVLSYLGSPVSATQLQISSTNGTPAAFHASARTFSSAAGGGTFGVAYPAGTSQAAAPYFAVVYGLKQDEFTRSNLAIVPLDPSQPLEVLVGIVDGNTGRSASVEPEQRFIVGWTQWNSILGVLGVRNGYVVINAKAPFFAYGIVNDGAVPGAGTGDGSYLSMSIPAPR